MEATTATTPIEASTGSKTIADLLALAAQKHADKVAVRDKVDGEWHDRQLRRGRRDRARDRARADRPRHRGRRARLHPLQHPPRVDATRLRRSPRPAPSSSRSTRPTPRRSASGCSATPGPARSSARTPTRWPRSWRSASGCPDLRTIIVIDPSGDVGRRDPRSTTLRERGRGGDRGRAARRAPPPSAPTTRSRSSTRRARPARRRAACSPTATTATSSTCARRVDVVHDGEVVYLFLPLAHAFALLIQLLVVRPRRRRSPTSAATRKQIVARAAARSSRPTSRRCRASSRRSTRSPRRASSADARGAARRRRSRSASRSATCRPHGQEVPEELQKPVRGGRRAACSRTSARSSAATCARRSRGAAPIAHEILEFFYAAGVPVLEGYGMTETATVATYSTVENHRSAPSGARCPASSCKIADDGEILIKGAEHLRRLLQQRRRVASAPSRTAGCTPATSARSTRTATCRSPAARRTSSSPRAARTSRRRTSRTTSSSALDLPGGHARRPPALPGRARSRSTRRRSPVRARSTACRATSPTLGAATRGARAHPGRARPRQRAATRRSSRSRSSRSSTTTSRRRPAS